MVRDSEGRVQEVVEEKAATPEQRAIREINSSIYCFTLEKLWPCLNALRPNNAHHELYLTDAIALLRQRRRTRAGAGGSGRQRNPGVQYARAPGRRGPDFPRAQGRAADGSRRNDIPAGDRGD